MRAGISTVIIPMLNQKDLLDVPDEAKQKLKFVAVENVDQVLTVALEKNGEDKPGKSASPMSMPEDKTKSLKAGSATERNDG